MTRTMFSTITVLALSFATTATSSANDIVDFFRAISGPPQIHHRHADSRRIERGHRDHDHRAELIPVSSRRSRGRSVYDVGHDLNRRSLSRYSSSRYRTSRPVSLRRSGVSFNVSLGHNVAPPPPVIPVAPGPAFGSFGHLPHPIGSIVTCPVPIETCVRVKDLCEIAPGAVPVVVAVRSPHLGQFGSCVEQVAYVEVLVPPCPLRRVRVSRCKTKVRLDYGRYEVDIVSCDGLIEIDYDN